MCGLCSRLRRGALYRFAAENGITKIALGHHRDDIVETLFLNMFFGGRLKAMPPKLLSENRRHIVIRPLAYVTEASIARYAAAREFPIIPCTLCGSQANMQRLVVKNMLRDWEQKFPGRIESIFLQHYCNGRVATRGPGAVRLCRTGRTARGRSHERSGRRCAGRGARTRTARLRAAPRRETACGGSGLRGETLGAYVAAGLRGQLRATRCMNATCSRKITPEAPNLRRDPSVSHNMAQTRTKLAGSRRPRKLRHAWETLSDEQLLSLRFCDLRLSIQGTELQDAIDRLYHELQMRGIRLSTALLAGGRVVLARWNTRDRHSFSIWHIGD